MNVQYGAVICENGHVLTSSGDVPDAFCSLCGAPTMRKCRSCETHINGKLLQPGPGRVDELLQRITYVRPSFCFNCAAAFPWTAAKLDAARELVAELKGLSTKERDQLTKSLDDIIRDTPFTELAVTRFKMLASKASGEAVGGLRTVVIDMSTEAARKLLLGV